MIGKAIARALSPNRRIRLIAVKASVLNRLNKAGVGRWIKPLMLRRHLARPDEIDIEITSSCDADCIMCPRKSMRRRVGPMDMDLFKKIVDEATALGVPKLCLNGYGEISTLRNAVEYLTYIRRKSRSIEIVVNTNGMRLTEDLARAYIETHVDVVNITIDGATAATFEQIRQHLRLDVVEFNVKRLIELRNTSGYRRPLVLVHMIRMPQNLHEADMFLHKWTGVADRAGLAGLVSRGGSIPIRGVEDRGWERTPCFLLWSQMPVLSDGTVAMCCDDWDGTADLGNVRDRSVKEIWTSAAHRRLQAEHLAGNAPAMPLCDGCRQPRGGPWWFSRVPESD